VFIIKNKKSKNMKTNLLTFVIATLLLFAMITTSGCCKCPDPSPDPDTETTGYKALVVAGNQWNEFYLNISIPPEYQYARTYITKIGNDTIVDGVQYKRLLAARDSLAENWQANGYIRENVEEQKVYYKPENNEESLLYAFDVQVGDSLETYCYIPGRMPVTIVINAIDSILINNVWHKEIHITSKSFLYDYYEETNHVWIEGVGGTDALLYSNWAKSWAGSHPPVLSCFYNNGNLIYKPNEQTECFVWKTDFSEFWELYGGGIIDIESFIAALMNWIRNN
jgi:hypothetical protein